MEDKDKTLNDQMDILFGEEDELSVSYIEDDIEASEEDSQNDDSYNQDDIGSTENFPEDFTGEKDSAGFIDDTNIEKEYKGIDFEAFNSLMQEVSDSAGQKEESPSDSEVKDIQDFEDDGLLIDPDDAEEVSFDETEDYDDLEEAFSKMRDSSVERNNGKYSDEYGEEEDDTDSSEYKNRKSAKTALGKKPTKKPENSKKANEMDSGAKSFLVFTIIVAIIVACAILYILDVRNIIEIPFLNQKTTEAETTQTEKPTEKKTETIAPTEKKETIEVSTPDSENPTIASLETEAPTEKTDEPTIEKTEEPTSTEPVTEETLETESETESTIAEETDPSRRILGNYVNLFVITCDTVVNVRQSSTTDSPVVGQIKNGGGGNIISVEGDWYHIVSGGIEGYVYSPYVLTGVQAEAIAIDNSKMRIKVTADLVNIRKEASGESELLGTEAMGRVFELLGESGGFYKISYNGGEAYVSMDFTSENYYLIEAEPYRH